MLQSRSPKVTKNLGGVFVYQLADCLEFDNEFILHHKVGEEIP